MKNKFNFKSQQEANNALTGKTVKIIGNKTGYDTPIGTIVKISHVVNYLPNNCYAYYTYNGNPLYAFLQDIEICPLTKEQLEESIKDLNNSIKELEDLKKVTLSKIEFISENGLEEFDENTFKSFHVLKMLDDNKLSRIEKAKLISKLVSE